jgi:hypothetical protein
MSITTEAVRSKIVETLGLDLIGPDNSHAFAAKLPPDPPPKWYRTGASRLYQTAILVEAVAETKQNVIAPENVFELVLSGPEVPGIHTCDTAATMRTMIEEAQSSLLLVGYAVHNVRSLFQPIADKLESIPEFKAVFCLDISRNMGDTSLESEIIRCFI